MANRSSSPVCAVSVVSICGTSCLLKTEVIRDSNCGRGSQEGGTRPMQYKMQVVTWSKLEGIHLSVSF